MATGATAAALGAVALLGPGGGGPGVLERAQAAVRVMPGEVLHTTVVYRPAGEPAVSLEQWSLASAPYTTRTRQVDASGAVTDGVFRSGAPSAIYSSASETILLTNAPPRPDGIAALVDPVERLQEDLASDSATVLGTRRLNGREVREIRTGGSTYFADSATLEPVRMVEGGDVYDVKEFERLPGTESQEVFDIGAAHPGATIDESFLTAP